MINYVLYNDEGVIVVKGRCGEYAVSEIEQRNPDLKIHLGYIDDPSKKRIVNGEIVDAPMPTTDELNKAALVQLRRKRDRLLADSDWTQINDVPFEPSQKAQWISYRKSLRDLVDQYSEVTDINDVQWPQKPYKD